MIKVSPFSAFALVLAIGIVAIGLLYPDNLGSPLILLNWLTDPLLNQLRHFGKSINLNV